MTFFSFCLLYFYSMLLESIHFLFFVWSVAINLKSGITLALVLVAAGVDWCEC